MGKITEVYELEAALKAKDPNDHTFDRDTLRFFGEHMSEMRILKDTTMITDYWGQHECYVLSTLQRNHPNGPARVYHYYDVETLDRIFPTN